MYFKMVGFTGALKLKILEATDLKPTNLGHYGTKLTVIDPYLSVNVDDILVAQTASKAKTPCPVWNEEFETDIENGQNLGITVFHNSIVPPDPFVANITVAIEDIIGAGRSNSDFWVRW